MGSPAVTNDEDYRFLAENSVDTLARAGVDRAYTYVSPACFVLLGYRPEEMLGKPVDIFTYPEDFPKIMAAAERAMNPAVDMIVESIRMVRKDGSIVWTETSVRIIRDPATNLPREFVVVMRDITERKLLEEKLAALALTDGLTGLGNRRVFDEALERGWKQTLANGWEISLLLLDVDHFKRFNDRYGHQVGDDCLRTIAATLRSSVRKGDVACRYGGEEFAIILPGMEAAAACARAETIRAAVESLRLGHEGNPEGGGFVTISIGVATALAREGGTVGMPEGLLLAGDTALYKAKQAGRNRVESALVVAPVLSR